jgi:PAS domain S-box-containing protein
MKELGHISEMEVLFDLSPGLLCLSNSKGYFTRVNDAFKEALGYTRAQLLSKPFMNFIDPDSWHNTNEQIAALAKSKPVSLFENRYRCSDGSHKWFSWNAFQLPDKTCFGSAMDITTFKVAAETAAIACRNNQLIFDHTLDLLFMLDRSGRFTRINKTALMSLGYEEKDLIGKCYFDLLHPGDLDGRSHIQLELKKENHQTTFTNRILCKNGSYLPVSWSGTWLPSERLIFAVGRDVTDSEKQKELLLQKERKLISLIESGDEIILILSAAGVYKFVSPSVKTILNSTPEFYLGKVTFQFIHPDDLAWVGIEFQAVLNTEKPVYIAPFRLQVSSGEWVWIETIATNRLSDPAIEGIVINAKDVTKRIKDEQEKRLISEELNLSNERFRLAIEATKDVIWDWNIETQRIIRDVSYQKLSGYNCPGEGDTVGGSWADCIFPDDKDRVLKSIEQALADPEKRYWRDAYRYLKTDQTISFISDHGYIVRNSNLEAIRMVGAMHDVTEGKEKEQQIIKQNEQLTEVALINSHQLRRPVASILGLIDLLEESVFDKGNREIIDHLKSTATQLDAITKRINGSITPS